MFVDYLDGKMLYLKDTKREKEREREIDFGIIFNLALITFYDLLLCVRARFLFFLLFLANVNYRISSRVYTLPCVVRQSVLLH